jgi:hypothetical protein
MELAAIEETMAQMTEAKLLQSLLTISAADGQHGVALRLELGEEPVPSAFS